MCMCTLYAEELLSEGSRNDKDPLLENTKLISYVSHMFIWYDIEDILINKLCVY
jgi:hypothetical protein